MNEILIVSTADTMDLAQKIAHAIVQEGEAACVNILPGIRSVYHWEEKLCDDSEILLLIKTTGENFEQIRKRIRELHSYDVPEVIAVPITAGDPDYLNWLHTQVSRRTANNL
ncbi:MAG: divalent-cation tolerance protein CutA [Acidobacteriota bacterium]|jgi:periplasmic divalent cation tolerance protein